MARLSGVDVDAQNIDDSSQNGDEENDEDNLITM